MNSHLYIPLTQPEDIIEYLAKKDDHWRAGYSAYELTHAWASTRDQFPASVKQVLDTSVEYRSAQFLDGFFERAVHLDTLKAPSMTDLLVLAALAKELALIAVESKVEEPADQLISDWNSTDGKSRRLAFLCKALQMEVETVSSLRYQFLHRAYSALHEARRFHVRQAVLLVHSFSRNQTGFEDFALFSRSLGMPIIQPNTCSASKQFDGVTLRLAWVADSPISPAQPRLTSTSI